MGALVSSLFRVMCFSHEGRIVSIDQLSFVGPNCVGPNWAPNQPASLNGSYTQVVSPSPQINYVATCSMPASTDYLVGDVVHHVLRALAPDLSLGSFDMYSFQSIVLPSDENLLEAMAFYGP